MRKLFSFIHVIVYFLLLVPSFATSDQQSKAAQIEERIEKAISNMLKVAIEGPSSVSLVDQAQIALAEDYRFIPKQEAADFMRAIGNGDIPALIGLVIPNKEGERWVISVKYKPEGYVREDDAKNLDAAQLLKDLKEGTEIANKERKREGYETFHVLGWIEKPNYDPIAHKLVWSIEGKVDSATPSASSEEEYYVNYHTYAFGRYGFIELTLMTDRAAIEESKVHATNVLKSINFENGKKYEDFIPGEDKVAKYGLTALIVGAAAKKLGLFALIGAFFIKSWKLLAVSGVVVFGAIGRLLSWRKRKVTG